MNIPEETFQPFQKIARLRRGVVITEKLDGTNAQIYITEAGDIHAGSRNRYLTPEADNFGFAGWVERNKEQLLLLGPGRHFGEWWGLGIQRGYGLTERRFSLFNTGRWNNNNPPPECCSVVPVLGAGNLHSDLVDKVLWQLQEFGSSAAPGFMKPEGIVVYHTALRDLFKVTLENDEAPKGQAEAA
jgi:hypothetical protein